MKKSEHIIVAGSPGALLHIAARYLKVRGFAVTWPGQDLTTSGAADLLSYGMNVELQRMSSQILWQQGSMSLHDKLPRWYDPPYPGPAEYLEKFDQPAVIADSRLPPFLALWEPYVDNVIDVQATPEEDVATIKRWWGGNFDDNYLTRVATRYTTRYRECLPSFRVFSITNSELRANRFDGIAQFLSE